MKPFKSAGLGFLLLATCSVALAQVPSVAPGGSTGLCKDGTYTNTDSRKGACAGHKGVKDWYGTGRASGAKAAASAAKANTTPKNSTEATTGGRAGQVWVNTATKVYHCPGTRYYGKTEKGEYMTESAAKAAGDRPDHGKACT